LFAFALVGVDLPQFVILLLDHRAIIANGKKENIVAHENEDTDEDTESNRIQ